jgi:maltose alpha-D-glucosyltransferase/alpha-amylase
VDRDAVVEKFEFGDIREWSTEGGSWLLATIVVTLSSGEMHRYAIPLALAWEDEGEARVNALLHAMLAKVRRRARMGALFDAVWDDRFCCALVSAMEQGARIEFGTGKMEFHVTSAFAGFACPVGAATVVRTVSERGRLLVNLDDRLVLKGYRQLLAGEHPELELSRFLTETAKFIHMPQLAGTAEYSDAEGHRSTLAILERYAENQGNAWAYTLDYLERFLDECRASAERPPDARHTAYVDLMKTLGRRTAEFHQALALPDETGAFGGEPITADDIGEWVNGVRVRLESTFELLEAELPQLPDSAQRIGNELLAVRPTLYRRIMRAAVVRLDCMKTRYHGDYHLGQVWLASNDFLIANYGGEPGRPWAERRRKHTPLRDVAGMMLSIADAGAAALDHVAGDSADAIAALGGHVEEWEALARRAFFRGYRRAMAKHASHPSEAAAAEAMIALFMAEKGLSAVGGELALRTNTVGNAMRRLIRVAQRKR